MNRRDIEYYALVCGLIVVFLLFALNPVSGQVVFITTGSGSCSGTIVGNAKVLTAAHCWNGNRLRVGDFDVQQSKRDPKKDLMLLWVPGVTGETPQFADTKSGDEVTNTGYSLGILMVFTGKIAAVVGNKIIVDIHSMRGSSGSPLYNSQHQIVGIITDGLSDGFSTVTVAVSAKVIKEFLEVK